MPPFLSCGEYMKITEVKRVRGQQYALVLDDNKDAPLTVDAATFDASWYRVDSELTAEQLETLLVQSRYNRTRSRALYYLSGRDYAAKELERKLYRCADRETAAAVVKRLVEVGLVNDAGYAERLAKSLTQYKQYPHRRVLQALQAKGISREDAQAAVDSLESEDFEQALALIRKKYYNKIQTPDGRQKTVAALARYGFPYDAVRRAIETARDGENDDEDWNETYGD